MRWRSPPRGAVAGERTPSRLLGRCRPLAGRARCRPLAGKAPTGWRPWGEQGRGRPRCHVLERTPASVCVVRVSSAWRLLKHGRDRRHSPPRYFHRLSHRQSPPRFFNAPFVSSGCLHLRDSCAPFVSSGCPHLSLCPDLQDFCVCQPQ